MDTFTDESGVIRFDGTLSGPAASKITRATYDIPATSVAFGSSLHYLPLTFNYGAALLDLTTPAAPTPVDSGTYSFTVYAVHPDDGSGASKFLLAVAVDNNDFGALVVNSVALNNDGTAKQVAVTLPFYVPAGSPCTIAVSQNASTDKNVTGQLQLQRLN